MATISDVAELSGFSTQTVSRVINDHPYVSPQTRKKVEAAIKKLGYRPNPAARALSNGQTNLLGVVSANTTLFGPASTIHAVHKAARQSGYSTTLYSLDEITVEELLNAVDELIHSGVDGLVLIIPTALSLAKLKAALLNTPVVLIENENNLGIPSVNVDQYKGSRLAVRHLIKMGHKNIAHIAGPQEWFDAQRRLHGWNDELDRISVSNRVSLFGDWSAESGYVAMKELLKNKTITAVFAANDAMALGALKFLSEQKISVPDDMSVIGFDDISESSYFIPALSTIQQDFQALGSAAIKLLLQKIRQETIASPRTYIDPTLIIRKSVKNIID